MGAAASNRGEKESRARTIRTKVKALAAFNPMARRRSLKARPASPDAASSRRGELLAFFKARREDKLASWQKLHAPGNGPAAYAAVSTTKSMDGSPSSEALGEEALNCGLCGDESALEMLSCRVCGRKYHRKCLSGTGLYTQKEMVFFDRAKTSIGWSCLKCENIFNLLTATELDDLSNDFDRPDINKDSSLLLEQYMSYAQRRVAAQENGRELTPDEQEVERQHFQFLDENEAGAIDFSEFLKHVATLKLTKRSKGELVSLLSPRELLSVRQVYNKLNADAESHVTMQGGREADRSWYTEVIANLVEDSFVSKDGEGNLDLRKASLAVDVAEDAGQMNWQDFLEHCAIFLISSRPNRANAPYEKKE